MVSDMKVILNLLIDGKDLEKEQAEKAMEFIMSGNATPAQIGAFLVALRLKGENFLSEAMVLCYVRIILLE